MVVVPKPDGRIRICVDLTKLNRSVQRECHPIPSVDHTLAQLGGAKIFSKLRRQLGVLASAPPRRLSSPYNVYNPVWEVLFQQAAIRDNISSRIFSEENARSTAWTRRSHLYDG